ncbi:hypothetical protein K439DRAFT_1619003 [Ramaria rubella]|nr:hypothetical protein K439DRAFT_1619003 [Ramaria rubella]
MDQKAASSTCAANRNLVWQDLQDYWDNEDQMIQDLAKKHNKTEKWMQEQQAQSLAACSVLQSELWYMLKHLVVTAQYVELFTDLEPGKKKCLQDLQQLAKETSSYKDIPEAEMDAMIHCLEEKQWNERKGIKSCPMAHVRDVKTTAEHVAAELKNLQMRCLTASMAITLCTKPSHSNQPIMYHDDVSRDFVELLFGMDMDEFTLKFEAYSLFRIQGVAKNDNQRKTMTKRIVCSLVKQSLRSITGDSMLEMEWMRYEATIANTHEVELVGWPVNPFDPHVLGVCDLETCLAALKGPELTCYWCKLTTNELDMHQEVVASKKASREIVNKLWKKWSDAGKKRGKKRARDEDSDKENEELPTSGQLSKKLKNTHSKSIVDSDVESD